jgi:hypothetical protein
MATIDLNTAASEQQIQDNSKGTAVVLDFPPYDGDVTIYIQPKTRTLLMKAINKAKKSPRSRRHTVADPDAKGGKRVVDGDENAALMEELADLMITDWEGVEDGGVVVECTRENKIALFNNLRLSNYLLEVAEDLAETLGAEVQKKSKTS